MVKKRDWFSLILDVHLLTVCSGGREMEGFVEKYNSSISLLPSLPLLKKTPLNLFKGL